MGRFPDHHVRPGFSRASRRWVVLTSRTWRNRRVLFQLVDIVTPHEANEIINISMSLNERPFATRRLITHQPLLRNPKYAGELLIGASALPAHRAPLATDAVSNIVVDLGQR